MLVNRLRLSILIPTLNAGESWMAVLEGVKNQSIFIPKKIIIDSGSTDATVEIALDYGFEVKRISKDDFNHGRVRQQLVDLSDNTDICIFLTQDAILATNDSIKNLVEAFNDPDVGLAYGRQLPHKNATILETHARLFNYPEHSFVRSYRDKYHLGFKVFFCSNSFAAYRKSALKVAGGFPSHSIMGEDALVSAKMLMERFKIAYVADAAVYHSHSYSTIAEFKRYFDTRVFHEQNSWLIEDFGKPTGEGVRFLRSEIKYVIRHDLKSIFKSITSLGAKWLGYKSGKYYNRLPYPMLLKLSMHKHYWKENNLRTK